MFSNDRKKMRDVFFTAWAGFRQQRNLSPLETLIVEVASKHPEYHHILDDSEANRDRDVFPEAGDNNPFMHMGLHLALIEQVNMDRPTGIKLAFDSLVGRIHEPHQAEHLAMECLAEWLAEGPPHIESDYLQRLTELGKG